MRRTFFIVAAVIAAAAPITACGDDDTMSPMHDSDSGMGHMDQEEVSPVADGARRIDVIASSFAYDPEAIEVEAGEDIAIVLTSDDTLHDFTIDELDAHVASDEGETNEGGFTADEAGTYTFYCSVAGHRDAGMEGTLTVT